MSYKIIVTPDAIQNIDDAIAYYKHKASIKVARNFIEDYRSAFKDIQKTIYFQIFFDNFRGKPLNRSPHIIFYTVDETIKTIVIKAIFILLKIPINIQYKINVAFKNRQNI